MSPSSPSPSLAQGTNPSTPPKTPTKSNARSTPAGTPPTPAGPSVRVTLPTPPSFSARKAAQRAQAEAESLALTQAQAQIRETHDEEGMKAVEHKKKGHNRSVSFNLPDLSPVSPYDDTPRGELDSPTTATVHSRSTPNSAPLASGATGTYKIPQRTLTSVSGGIIAPSPSAVGSGAATSLPFARRGPPRPLNLGSALATNTSAPRIKTAAAALGGTSTGFITPSTTPSRWSNTAAARGLSLNPTSLGGATGEKGHNKRHSTSMSGSIWSAALPNLGLGESSGWISPALASARSVMGNNRTRGLTVAVLKAEGAKELLIETLPTPGLPKNLEPVSEVKTGGKEEGDVKQQVQQSAPGTPLTGSSVKPRERARPVFDTTVILCRYYHTPGLTCTSRPCRFVHSLDKLSLSLSNEAGSPYEMRSPRTATGIPNLPKGLNSAKSDVSASSASNNKNPHPEVDPTSGTFAAHQLQSRMKTLSIKDVDEKGIEPGEHVTVASPNGNEIPGVVFLMSGGGKGAVGKSKIKFKTEQCRDFAAGHCPYGDYCSFLHGEMSRTPDPAKSSGTLPSPAAVPDGKSEDAADRQAKEAKAARRRSLDPAAIRKPAPNAWKSGPPLALRPTPLKLDQSNIVDADAARLLNASKDDEAVTTGDTAHAPLSAKPKLSAFAVPYSDKPVEVDNKGNIVPATPRSARLPMSAALKSANGPMGTFAAAQKSAVWKARENLNPSGPASVSGPGPAPVPGRSALAGAWRKGAPKSLTSSVTVRIIEPPLAVPSLHSAPSSDGGASSVNEHEPEPVTPIGAQTLLIPSRGPHWTGLASATDSDPATPWDPALRAARNRDVAADDNSVSGATDEDGSLVTQQSAMYGYGHNPYAYSADDSGSASWASLQDPMADAGYPYGADNQYVYSGEEQHAYPYGAPTYPWGMPMSPIDENAGKDDNAPARGPQGSLGVMWTPSGWAVQDAAMKMALFTAEAKAAGEETGIKVKNYWRTRKCRFFAEGSCPHGDSCTFIHSTSTSPVKPTFKAPHAKARTQPCKFFNSATGCHNADACNFLHTMVVPESAPLVEKPRPWRTRPCRHFQQGRCHLGDACHFAHVYERPQGAKKQDGNGEYLTEERLERAMREMKALKVDHGEESDDDDIEIVTTGDNSMSISLSRSHSGSTIV